MDSVLEVRSQLVIKESILSREKTFVTLGRIRQHGFLLDLYFYGYKESVRCQRSYRFGVLLWP